MYIYTSAGTSRPTEIWKKKKERKDNWLLFLEFGLGLYNAARRHAAITSPELSGLAQQWKRLGPGSYLMSNKCCHVTRALISSSRYTSFYISRLHANVQKTNAVFCSLSVRTDVLCFSPLVMSLHELIYKKWQHKTISCASVGLLQTVQLHWELYSVSFSCSQKWFQC